MWIGGHLQSIGNSAGIIHVGPAGCWAEPAEPAAAFSIGGRQEAGSRWRLALQQERQLNLFAPFVVGIDQVLSASGLGDRESQAEATGVVGKYGGSGQIVVSDGNRSCRLKTLANYVQVHPNIAKRTAQSRCGNDPKPSLWRCGAGGQRLRDCDLVQPCRRWRNNEGDPKPTLGVGGHVGQHRRVVVTYRNIVAPGCEPRTAYIHRSTRRSAG